MYFLKVKKFDKKFLESSFLNLKRNIKQKREEYEYFQNLTPIHMVRQTHDSIENDFDTENIVLNKWNLS